ncbi:hypothetical protein GTO10_05270 [Candidatus Saccharibacteria bacterium]|nr:hypothetical protein [Candidatus Saccharibacteria bacterium]
MENFLTSFLRRIGVSDFDDKWVSLITKDPFSLVYFPTWRRLKNSHLNTLDVGVPWYSFKSIEWRNSFLRKGMKIFEWGSGGSTLFFSQRVADVTTIEHDFKWFTKVASVLKEKKFKNVHIKLVNPTITKEKLTSNKPNLYRSASKNWGQFSFKNYCMAIDRYKDESFELVAVDGRARPSCILHAIPKVKVGGYLLLDNSDREEYKTGVDLLVGWKRTDFKGPFPFIADFLQTSVFKKP